MRAAVRLWDAGAATVSVGAAADEAGVDRQAASLLFGNSAELAYSALRLLIFSLDGYSRLAEVSHPSPAERRVAMSAAVALLRRIVSIADRAPGPIAALLAYPEVPRPSTLDVVRRELADALQFFLPAAEADRRAARLLEFALTGSPGWPTINALLETLPVP